jgi:hypothetical protein
MKLVRRGIDQEERIKLTRFMRVFSSLAFLIAIPLAAAPRTFVSAATGLDTNPCTPTAPCRSFSAALAVTDADGEAIAVDSGGYGAVTVTQGVSLIAPDGVYAGLTPTVTFNGVRVSAGAAHVVLRNLVINSGGGESGIRIDSVGHLYIAKCSISGFQLAGILSQSSSPAILDVSDTTIRRCTYGVEINGSTQATLERMTLIKNGTGGFMDGSQAIFRNSVVSGGDDGFTASANSRVIVEDTSVSGAGNGFRGLGGALLITRCTISMNGSGVFNGGGTALVVDSTISANTQGVVAFNGGTNISRGNNTLYANTTDGTFSSTFAAQ